MKLPFHATRSGLFLVALTLGAAAAACGGNVTVSGSAGNSAGGGGAGTGGSGMGGSLPTTTSSTTTPTVGGGGASDLGCDGVGTPIPGLASAISMFNEGTGTLRIDLSSADKASCEDPYYFPPACEKAWRLRLEIPPEAQQPGTYPLGPGSTVFAYLDGQAPGGGMICQNTGGDFTGTLTITQVGKQYVNGHVCDNAEVSGSFITNMCSPCLGTGQTCASDGQCCNLYCNPSSKHCDP